MALLVLVGKFVRRLLFQRVTPSIPKHTSGATVDQFDGKQMTDVGIDSENDFSPASKLQTFSCSRT